MSHTKEWKAKEKSILSRIESTRADIRRVDRWIEEANYGFQIESFQRDKVKLDERLRTAEYELQVHRGTRP